jgi:hypothetical protein
MMPKHRVQELIMAKQPKEITRELFEESGRRGGAARAAKLTPAERTRIAKLAAQARWAKKATAPDPTDPQGPKRDPGGESSGIMSTRKPCRQTGVALTQPTLFDSLEAA